jgi:spectinomycin phosphotransferase
MSRSSFSPIDAKIAPTMLEKPDLPDDTIVACLQADYGLHVVEIAFLPLGIDPWAAVYRAVSEDYAPYFVKLRWGAFDEASVTLPRILSGLGIRQIIAPLTASTGRLWASLDGFKLILYPFVEGRNGYEVGLSDQQWVDFGRALRGVHTAAAPLELTLSIQRETYSAQWRENLKTFLERAAVETFDDPISIETAVFLKAKAGAIRDLITRAERLAQKLRAQSPEFVVCHSDLHAGNVLLDANDALYIVDWDSPILAPKERDLMSIGGGLMGDRHTPQAEEALFYRGYGQTEVDSTALAYYRYERIIQDIAVEYEEIFLSHESHSDRERALHYMKSNFLRNGIVEIAYQSDVNVTPELNAPLLIL